MIPVKLELTNFLSYRKKQTLEFKAVHLAGISGQNGAGKSSLLEGITWSLFGKSRSRSDDDVVNKVAAKDGERAEVRFTFQMEGQTYRVLRRKKKGGRVTVEFQLQRDGENWTTLTESKVRETQAKIERTLGMNYDTFVNISFFLQGRADEFTTKTAGQRKEILADLLGVNRWDAFRERAAEVRKSAENELLLLDARIEEADVELGQQEERESSLAALQANLDKISAQLETQTVLLNQVRRAADNAKRQEREVQQRGERLVRDEKRLADLEKTRAERGEQQAKLEATLENRAAIEGRYAQLQKAIVGLETWETKSAEFTKLQSEMRPFELAIEREQSRLQQAKSELEAREKQATAMQKESEALAVKLAEQQKEIERLGEQSAEMTAHETTYQTARDELQQLITARQLIEQEASQLKRQQQQIERSRIERTRLQKDWRGSQAKIDNLTNETEKLVEMRLERTRLQTQRNELHTQINPRLKEEVDTLHERVLRLEADSGEVCPICGQDLTAEHKVAVLADIRKRGKVVADDLRANRRKVSELTALEKKLDDQLRISDRTDKELQREQSRYAKLGARIEEIGRVLTEWDDSDNANRLKTIIAQLADDEAFQQKEIRVRELEHLVKNKSVLERAVREAQATFAKMEARSAEITRFTQQWAVSGNPQLATITETLENQTFEKESRAALKSLVEKQQAVGYDAEQHTHTRQTRNGLKDAVGVYEGLKSAEAGLQPLAEAIVDLDKQIVHQQETIDEARQSAEDARAQLAAFRAEAKDLDHIENTVATMRTDHIEASRQVGGAQQRVAILDEQRKRRKRHLAERETLTEYIRKLKNLETACGRDGIQALLIEQAIPEIEDSANELLDRLTDSTMRITFDTQRQLKTSDTLRETLDIKILDSSGERPYENYSGGEKFRINFAIRLALSQILSKRAGARLQTLVIDEGFGSQDSRGRDRIVEAIQAIKDDFSCILVITHIEELRESFTTRIQVSKSPTGSRLQLTV